MKAYIINPELLNSNHQVTVSMKEYMEMVHYKTYMDSLLKEFKESYAMRISEEGNRVILEKPKSVVLNKLLMECVAESVAAHPDMMKVLYQQNHFSVDVAFSLFETPIYKVDNESTFDMRSISSFDKAWKEAEQEVELDRIADLLAAEVGQDGI